MTLNSSTDLYQRWLGTGFPTSPGIVTALVSVAISWHLFVTLPLLATRSSFLGRTWGKIALTVLAVLDVGRILAPPSLVFAYELNVLIALAAVLTAALSWTIRSSAGLVGPATSDQHAATSANVLTLTLGLVGAHCVYLRRSWEAVLIVSLVGLGFVSGGNIFSLVVFLVASSIIVFDFAQTETRVRRGDSEVKAKRISTRLGTPT